MQNERRTRVYFFITFRALLVVAGLGAVFRGDWINFILSLFALLLTFLPTIIKKEWKFDFPSIFETLILIFIYLSVFPEIAGQLLQDYWWWEVFLNALSTVVISAITFSLVYLLFWERQPYSGMTPVIIAVFSFCLSFTMTTAMEISFFALESMIDLNVQHYEISSTVYDFVFNLFRNLVITLLVALAGFVYIRYHEGNLLTHFVTEFTKKNPNFFKRFHKQHSSSEEILGLIANGEGNTLEFKSTLRTNLHTSKPDKRIEYAITKTIVAYLNSDGGSLLVGVSDDGSILGIEEDNFQNNDKFNLHFTNMFGRDIGNEFLPYINAELVNVQDKFVLRVDCSPSDNPVFLKEDATEIFYIRSSAATIEISGRKLLEYINSRFRV
ncbi:ATP-binding protein [Methanolobus sp. WCC1]|uniref:AlbA family DNA-binding domain-containing protein n=1 Tax=unclassified Methanolobus TaxID=2629569 RepID=UPI0032515169